MSTPLTDHELALLASMFDLARDGSTDELLRAIGDGVPVNLTNDSGDTLLVLAAYHNHPETVRRLLESGADTERVNDRGQTALGAAVFRQSRVNVLALLAAGAEPDTGARSALDVARFFHLPDMTALLEHQPRQFPAALPGATRTAATDHAGQHEHRPDDHVVRHADVTLPSRYGDETDGASR